MSEQSYPVEGAPLPASQWSEVTRGIGNGILDQGGFPYRLVFESDANATNQGVLKCPTVEGKAFGAAILEGFFHKYTADIVLDFPAVTRTTTYYVVLQCVPTRATEGGLPVKAEVVTSLDMSQGKNYLHLYNVTRNPNELLNDAAVRMIRPRVAPVQVYSTEADLPQARKTLWGTLAVINNGRSHGTAKIMMAMTGDGEESVGGWFWKTVYDPNGNAFDWTDIADTGTYRNPGSGFQRALGRRGRERKLRGRVSLVSGNKFAAGGDYTILSGPINVADTPAAVQRFTVSTGGYGAGGHANLEVSSMGAVTLKIVESCYWVSLDGVEWEARA